VLVIETIGQLYMITDRYFFNQISEGGLSALSYAMNLYLLPISIFSFALATVVFPKFSEYLQKKEYKVFEKNFMDAIRVNLLIFIPIALIYFFYGEELIKILFERGKFTGANSASTFLVLRIYSVSLIFYSIYSILNKVLYGAKLVNALFLIATTGLIIKIVLNFILVNEYQQNGLAIATSISFIFYFFSSIILIYVKFELQNKSFLGKEIIFYACNGLISYFVVFIFSKTLALTFSHNQIIQLILFCILFYMNLLIVKHNSISLLKTMLTSIGSK
jgi:putative peptidoglycan lipid II flippase